MTEREQLENEHVEAGVAKWGESEREGLVAQAKGKKLAHLRAESDARNGREYAGRTSKNIALHCNDNGFS